jgi:ubiquinone/menaquinone biosynthesis C-methylase UbiE
MKDSDHDLQGRDPALYYRLRKHHYRDDVLASRYDDSRFGGARARRNAAKWRAISRAMDRAGDIRTVLDLPTGTGRFLPQLIARGVSVVGADISREMMLVGRKKAAALAGASVRFAQCDAEALPFSEGSFDCVLTIRFLFHLTAEARVRALTEFARVSRRWVIADYRHRYSLRYVRQATGHRLRLRGPAEPRVSRSQMEAELVAAGLRTDKILSIAPVFSDKWVVLCERT